MRGVLACPATRSVACGTKQWNIYQMSTIKAQHKTRTIQKQQAKGPHHKLPPQINDFRFVKLQLLRQFLDLLLLLLQLLSIDL
jgi:hypothetical protein